MSPTTTAASVVARVAFLASDVVVDSRPDSLEQSAFADAYSHLSRTATRHTPTVLSLPHGADPGSTILRRTSAGVVSYTATPTNPIIARIVPHLATLAHHAVVLHLAVHGDLAPALLLRASAPFFIYSDSAQQAHDHALLATRLAKSESKVVVHAFRADAPTSDVEEVAEDAVQPFVHAPKSSPTTNGVENGHTNGHVNGSANGHANGQANGHTNAHANGHANGYANGHANGYANGHTNGHIEDKGVVTEYLHAYDAAAAATIKLVRRAQPVFTYHGSKDATTALITLGHLDPSILSEDVALVSLSLISPFPSSRLLAGALQHSTSQLLVLEQLRKWSTKWTPLYLDVISSIQERDLSSRVSVRSATLAESMHIAPKQLENFIGESFAAPASSRLVLGSTVTPKAQASMPAQVPKHEASYTKILEQLFGDRLDIANSPQNVQTHGTAATTPEFALGRIRAHEQDRSSVVIAIQQLLDDSSVPQELHSLLSKWMLAKDEKNKSHSAAKELLKALELTSISHPAITHILSARQHLALSSRWIVGSDAWSYDLGASGLHHVIASKMNVNVLLLDTVPYSSRTTVDPARRKQDAGLYAMNHGDVYVASIAVYSSYGQVLQALSEADAYPGPSIVLAYLPYTSEASSALDVLKETKLAVDAGYWPLYRWNPAKDVEGSEPFTLDSDAIKTELRTFLDRHNHISLLERSTPAIASEIIGNLGDDVRDARKRRAKKIYEDLVTAIDAPPLTVLYASDGGKAEKVAKRLAARGKARGLSTTLSTMDALPLDSLAQEEFVVFITSVAGQGEFPQNARTAVKAFNQAALRGETPLTNLKYSVFGMGDSHYWPRPEDAHYYNKAGKDLDNRLASLGGERFAEVGLGDDQDPDGPETGYKAWEPLVWKALGVDAVEVTEAEPEAITNEHIKAASNYLRGTIVEGLEDASTGALAPSDGQLTKFHGIYQQDDRDIRDERQAQGVEPAFSFMIRVRLPGGVCTPDQWLTIDRIADEHGNGTFKITTRSTFQFHGVIKRHLKPAMQDINRALMDTLAACGDVNRNVLVSAIPTLSQLHAQVYAFSVELSEHLLPRTTAYHEIWLDKKMVAGEALKDVEPLYGEFYLPRKFKVAVAVPPTNDVDVFANDVGFIAIVNKRGELDGFNVAIGGGMGVTHGNKKTYPRTASIIGFCLPEEGKYVAEKIMLVQRDNGNRVDRKNARLKYTVDRMGLDVFKSEVEKLLGYELAPARPYTFDRNVDDYGWHKGEDGKHHVMLFIENGRVQDEPGKDFKTGLREIAKIHKGTFRLTANQHIMISGIPEEDVSTIKALLAKYKLDDLNFTGLRLSSSACVAFPTCGLAMAESERYLPLLIDKVEKICEENGLRNDSIVMRMTGCPNGCARPYIAEVAFVGKAPGTYLMLLGGGYHGQRLNKIYRESVTEPEILAILKPMIKRYALERFEGEHFGDFVIRAGYIAPTTEGKAWYDKMGGEGEHRLVAA